ncbi:hypothetical protein Sa4125_27320 [Aureimonas sp. SA4125]|nr:hypothetical protein Sa4125_27320 [Aureimonas sp. SA4125]
MRQVDDPHHAEDDRQSEAEQKKRGRAADDIERKDDRKFHGIFQLGVGAAADAGCSDPESGSDGPGSPPPKAGPIRRR